MNDSSTEHFADDADVRQWAAAARGAQPPAERAGLRDEVMREFDAALAQKAPGARLGKKLWYLAAGVAAAAALSWGAVQLSTHPKATQTAPKAEELALEAVEQAAREAIAQARLEAVGATLEALAKAPAVAAASGAENNTTKATGAYPSIEAAAEAAAVPAALLTQLAVARRIEEIDRQEAAARYRKILMRGSDGAVERVAQERLRSLFP